MTPVAKLSHIDASGKADMVDVSAKSSTARVAVAEGRIIMQPETVALIRAGDAKKGDVIGVARVAGILLTAGALAVTGLMLWQHRKTADHRHLEAENVAAARQGVVNLMSIDSTAAKETVQRLIDDSTGKFQANFKDGSDDLIKAMQDAKVVTKVTVNDVAVDEIDGDTAILLVAATTERRDAQAPKEDNQPRVWRVVLTVVRDGGDIKMSDVEFV